MIIVTLLAGGSLVIGLLTVAAIGDEEETMAEGEWYYCLDHKQVEPAEGCKSISRLGPYPTREAAEHALEKVAERNEEWDNDPRWNDED